MLKNISRAEVLTAALPEQVLLEQGDPCDDSRIFRRALGQFATGVAIVTAQVGEQRIGVTVNSFSSVSLNPPLIQWSISRASRSFTLFEACDRFAVNVLSAGQIDISRHFSSQLDEKFVDVDWVPGQTGMPLVVGAVAQFECRRESAHDGGDHVILVGRVEHFARFSGEPLLFVQGQYGVAENHPDLPPVQEAVAGSAALASHEDELVSLIFDAHHCLSARFEAHRKEEGVSTAIARVLAGIYNAPGIPIDALTRTTYLGERDAEDAVTILIERSFVVKSAGGGLTLTADGRRRREAIRKRWAEFQAGQVSGISASEMARVSRTLKQLIAQNKTTS